ncbi:MAG: hypothetical protein NZ954_00455 [Thermofilaceae archaeon]|nr:hypothetical protein [Thermofilaceae archaeon]MCX8180349.1 hypothetical protein [Thermofilaceae archaeon]MDW8003884.1 hypothetical protein [Thermofilaceae archaeon]
MERLLLYFTVTATVLAVLSTLPRLRQQPDYCAEARRLAAAVITVYQSKGWFTDVFTLNNVAIDEESVRSLDCGVEIRVPTANFTILKGRMRLKIVTILTGQEFPNSFRVILKKC